MTFEIEMRPGCLDFPDRFDLISIEAAMLWPDDAESREAASCTALVERFRGGAAPDGFATELIEMAADAMPLRYWHGEVAKNRFVHGKIAGAILYGVLSKAQCDPDNASIGEQMDIAVRTYGLKKIGGRVQRLSNKTVKTAWARFKPVAHFWAAWVDCVGSAGDQTFPCRHRDLKEFLTLAESYRVAGENTRTKQSPNQAILSPGTSVSLPNFISVEPFPLQFELRAVSAKK